MTPAPLLLALAALQPGGAPATPAGATDWQQIETGPFSGAIRQLYVEKRSLKTANGTKLAWIFATLDTSQSPYSYKTEQIAIDCAHSRYEGVQWVWGDTQGQIFQSQEGDTRWIAVTVGSPAESIMRFVCAQP